jgi:ubiquinone/menaquinone biosynthesis C-methylase UbiE
MKEFDLLSSYPSLNKRYVSKNTRKIENRIVASYRGKEFYDGKRNDGYGGFKYDGRWQNIAKRIFEHYKLKDDAKILQIGSDKGFLLNDLKNFKPKCTVAGVEISEYAIKKTLKKVKRYVKNSYFFDLPYNDNYFDFVIAIGPVYSLNLPDAIKCLKEIKRVGKGKSFITLGAYNTEREFKLFRYWTLLGSSILDKKEWIKVLRHCKYTGDYKFNTAASLNLKLKIEK